VYLARAKGSTVHLLKNRAKKIRASKPRKTFDVLAPEKRRRDVDGNV